MFRSIEDFHKDWKNESDATLKIFQTVTDESLKQKVYAEGRTLGRLAWHITGTLGEMPQLAGLKFSVPTDKEPLPADIALIVNNYTLSAAAFSEAVKNQWNDAMLGEEVPMYGEQWKRGEVLSSIIRHQAHHRAQMTVLMRQAGLNVPGVYGPSKGEWKNYGMEPEE